MDAQTASSSRLMFEATIAPHRSLSRQGMVIVICCMMAGSLTVTSMMFLLGAWPVIGFNGADLLLAIFLLWLNVRAARAREILRLTESSLNVISTDPQGRQTSVSLPPYWLKISLEERAGSVPKLLLSTPGASREIARQLGETEKRDLAAALTNALHRWRNPRFDNPQLRDN